MIFNIFRSFHQRQRVKTAERTNFENYYKANGVKNFQDLEYLLKRLLYFYDYEITKDCDTLVSNNQ